MNNERSILKALLVSPYSLFVAHGKSGFVLDVSPSFTDMYGYEPQKCIGKNVAEMPMWANPKDGALFVDLMRKSRFVTHWATEFSCFNKTCSPFALTTTEVTRPGGDNWVLISGREKSEQIKIESALKHSESLYREAQQIARLGHWELDIRESRLIWSDEIFRIFDINPDDFSASYETFLSLIHPEDRNHVDRVYKKSLEDRTFYDVTHRLLMKNGQIKFVHERGQSQWDENGEPLRSFGTVQDITALKEAEDVQKKLENQLRQSQKLEAIGTLAGGIAHDFNNILFAILGYTEMSLEMAEPKNPMYQNLAKVLEAGNRARDLVTQILTFCRKTPEKKASVQIRLIVMEVLSMIRATLPTTIRIYDRLMSSSQVSADSGQMHQVIMNLCANAAYAMRRNDTAVLTVELDDMELDDLFVKRFVNVKPGRYVKLAIGDTGEGMSEAVKERIFEPFFTTKGEGDGTGLGLSVVHGIIKNHGGHILVYSEEGLGTTFKIFLPVIDTPEEGAYQKAPALPRGREHILVVDDEPMIADVLTAMLQSLGYTVEHFVDSGKAFEAFESKPRHYDLIISDMTMPGMNGLRLSEKILAIHHSVPVIITTGFSEKISEILIEKSGIKKILFKPIVKQNLASAVRQCLDQKQHDHEPETQH